MPLIASLALVLMTTVSPGTDTTVAVKPGTRLGVDNFSGSVTVTTWAKNAVRVHAEHHRHTFVEIESSPGRIDLTTATRMGVPSFVDYQLTVPTWMPFELSGVANDVSVDGLKADLEIETVKGDITVRNSTGTMNLSSVEGEVVLNRCGGVIEASSVNEDVDVSECGGDVRVESVNGTVTLLDMRGPKVDATSVNGEILYSGAFTDGGSYSFSTHNGDVTLGVPERSNLSGSVSTYSGGFNSSFPVQLTERHKGREFRFTIGTGAASVEIEAFQGEIRLVRPEAIAKTLKEHELKRASDRKDKDDDESEEDKNDDQEDR